MALIGKFSVPRRNAYATYPLTIETGHANALANDYSSTAYWYQAGRTEPLPPLPPVEARIPRPDPPEL
jgi:hypothetical protein